MAATGAHWYLYLLSGERKVGIAFKKRKFHPRSHTKGHEGETTAAVSGGKVYLEQLLPRLARIADGHEFIIFHTGEFDELALSSSRSKFEFRRVALRFSDVWIGAAIAAACESALPEMAADAAVYFDPYNAGAMADVLDRLVWDESLRDALREKAIARAAAFSWAETARKTMAVFERVAGFDVPSTER